MRCVFRLDLEFHLRPASPRTFASVCSGRTQILAWPNLKVCAAISQCGPSTFPPFPSAQPDCPGISCGVRRLSFWQTFSFGFGRNLQLRCLPLALPTGKQVRYLRLLENSQNHDFHPPEVHGCRIAAPQNQTGLGSWIQEQECYA